MELPPLPTNSEDKAASDTLASYFALAVTVVFSAMMTLSYQAPV